jgi:hypothetical protein
MNNGQGIVVDAIANEQRITKGTTLTTVENVQKTKKKEMKMYKYLRRGVVVAAVSEQRIEKKSYLFREYE